MKQVEKEKRREKGIVKMRMKDNAKDKETRIGGLLKATCLPDPSQHPQLS